MAISTKALHLGQRLAAATAANLRPASSAGLHSGRGGGDQTSGTNSKSVAASDSPKKSSTSGKTTASAVASGAAAQPQPSSPGKNRFLHYESASSPNTSTARERSRTVGSFYNQTAIDDAAAKPSVRLTPATIMYSGASSTTDNHDYLMKSAIYLHREMPIRVAHRIAAIRTLPFIVGCNPTILAVHEQYIRSFHILNDFPPIETPEQEERFAETLKELLDDHKNVVTMLAQGFKECRKHINVSQNY